jgi:hypothetical protein
MRFEEIWALLDPQGEFKRRRGACERLWGGYEAARQAMIYERIAGKKQRGEFVNPNPYFAIEDNAAMALPMGEPTDYNHRKLPNVPVFSAKYKGKWGMYTLEDIRRFRLETAKE